MSTSFPRFLSWVTELKQLFAAYVEAKQSQNVLDYDDLLLYWAQMMSDPALAADVGGRFDHVLVDEYQDTNRLQSSILLGLRPTGQGLTVVGDDAQSIYSFRAATVRNILDFPSHFSPPANIITLDRNYVPRRLSWAPPTASSVWRPSVSPRTSGRIALPAPSHSSSACATTPIKHGSSSSACLKTARLGLY